MWFSDDYKSCLCLWWRKVPYHTIRAVGDMARCQGQVRAVKVEYRHLGLSSGAAVPRAAVGVLDLRGGHRGGAPPLLHVVWGQERHELEGLPRQTGGQESWLQREWGLGDRLPGCESWLDYVI